MGEKTTSNDIHSIPRNSARNNSVNNFIGVWACCFLLKIFTLKCSESTWQRSLKNRFHPFRCVNFFSDFSWQNTSVCFVRFLLAWIPYSWPHHTRITIIQFLWMQTLALHIAIPQSSAKLRYKWPAQTSIWFLNSKTSKRDTKMN